MTDPDDEPAMRTEELNYPETLRLTLADAASTFDDALAAADAAERGEEHQPEAVRAFRDVDDLRQLITDRRLEVLRAIYDDPPESIAALATRLGRAYAVVHGDVKILAEHGVVEFREGARGAKQPYVPYDTIRVDVPVVGSSVPAPSLEVDAGADSRGTDDVEPAGDDVEPAGDDPESSGGSESDNVPETTDSSGLVHDAETVEGWDL